MCLTVRYILAGFCIGNPFSVLDLQNALSGGGIFLHHVLAHHIRIVGVEGSNPFESTTASEQAAYRLLRLFMPRAKKSECAHSAAPP